MTVPGIAWVLGYTIAAEIGDINRFASRTSCPATPACARASTSPASATVAARWPRGPKYLRWALIEATTHAAALASTASATRPPRSLGNQRGKKIAQIDIARKLSEAIWHMLTRNQPFAPAGARSGRMTALPEMRPGASSHPTWSSPRGRDREMSPAPKPLHQRGP